PVTLRRLLTHTSGFSYDIWNADVGRYMEANEIPGVISCENKALTTPLVFEPGERWEYGIGIDWAGKAVEKVSGLSLDAYLREHVLGPLGMSDTGFVMRPDQRERLCAMHVRNEDGTLSVMAFEVPQAPEFYMGGGGLYGAGPDYVKFMQMILNEGRSNGARILKPETVAQMRENQIGSINVEGMLTNAPAYSNDAEFFPGMVKKWGLGFMLNTERAPTGRSAGSLTWAGLANTYFWIDPAKQIAGVILTQVLPFVDREVMRLYADFETAAYEALG
ncbi:MAG: serine hydrolase domain-containing protein, partial [Gammaproteobacteria bacterium]